MTCKLSFLSRALTWFFRALFSSVIIHLLFGIVFIFSINRALSSFIVDTKHCEFCRGVILANFRILLWRPVTISVSKLSLSNLIDVIDGVRYYIFCFSGGVRELPGC